MWKKLLCRVFGHDYVEVQQFSNTSRVVCPRCRSDWGVHWGLKMMIDWTPELEACTRQTDNGVLIHNPWRDQ